MKNIMEGKATPAQIAAFLVALRIKGETSEEVASFADAVIVGSAIIKKIMENINRENMVEKVGSFVYSLCKSIKDENNPLL